MNNNVTIVIPVYSDWSSLNVCIQSLKKYVSKNHKIILVNDRGPDWEKLEQKILAAISDLPNFEYYKNDQNLGFVKTCNRAVFDIDKSSNDVLLLNSDTEATEGFLEEMQTVLYAAEKHGAVCPRSCQSDILTIPVHNELGRTATPEESYKVWKEINSFLSRQQVIPTGVGFAILIKRSIIDQYGLFDEIYSPGYNEENDFCSRINQYGFNIMMANHAYVYHYESLSFGDRRKKLDEDHRDILKSRYPYYSAGVKHYFNSEINAVDYFADMIAPIGVVYSRPRVLIDLYELPGVYNGTAQHGLSFLEAFYRKYREKYDISILITPSVNEFFKLYKKYPNVVTPDKLDSRFHIAYSPTQIISAEHMYILNRAALKYVFCMQDIISIRSRYLLLDDPEREEVFRKSIRYCDGILPCSDFSMDDTRDYYAAEFERRNIYTKTVYEAETTSAFDDKNEQSKVSVQALPFDHYFMVLGNQYKHKNLDSIVPYLKTLPHNFIVIGGKATGHTAVNVYEYKSGSLSNRLMNQIIEKCTAVIFPSVYEGFGLPIFNAIHYNKKIILNNNPLNREQVAAIPYYQKNVFLFDNKEQISGYLDEIQKSPEPVITGEYIPRTWDDEAADIEKCLVEIMDKPFDVANLTERWNDIRYEEQIRNTYSQASSSKIESFIKSNAGVKTAVFMRRHFPKLYSYCKKFKARK